MFQNYFIIECELSNKQLSKWVQVNNLLLYLYLLYDDALIQSWKFYYQFHSKFFRTVSVTTVSKIMKNVGENKYQYQLSFLTTTTSQTPTNECITNTSRIKIARKCLYLPIADYPYSLTILCQLIHLSHLDSIHISLKWMF